MARKRKVPDSKPPPIEERGKPEEIPLPQRQMPRFVSNRFEGE